MDVLDCVTKLNMITAILIHSVSGQLLSTPRHVHIVLVTESVAVEGTESLCRVSLQSPKERQRIHKPTSNLIVWHFKRHGEMFIGMKRYQLVCPGQAMLEWAGREFSLSVFLWHRKKLYRARRKSDCFPDTVVIRPHGISSAQ